MKSKTLKGKVVSVKMQKTCVVEVGTAKKHKRYNKRYVSHKRYLSHYEGLTLKKDDVVLISPVAPISKNKHFIVVEKLS